jgi:putative glutamine amidotransferase
MRPKILITSFTKNMQELPGPRLTGVRVSYVDAVYRAGGIPLILPSLTDEFTLLEILNTVDGILFSGGEDIEPQRYGDLPLPTTASSAERDEIEFYLADLVYQRGMPCLAICRGCQLWGVKLGARLIQEIDIPGAKIKHDNVKRGAEAWIDKAHAIKIKKGTKLSQILGADTDQILVNSLHHQAIDEKSIRADTNLVVSAKSYDGIVEAIEMKSYSSFFIGVQSHIDTIVTLNEKIAQDWFNVFQEFVASAALYARRVK